MGSSFSRKAADNTKHGESWTLSTYIEIAKQKKLFENACAMFNLGS